MANLPNTAYTIDRIEDGVALCECLQTDARISVDVKYLPPNAKEGDIILQDEDGFVLDVDQTTNRK